MSPTPLTLHILLALSLILLALSLSDQFPIEIRRQVAADSVSLVLPADSTFYKALRRLEGEGLVEMVGMNRRYHLTNRGRQVLRGERVRVLQVGGLLRSRVN
jgi:DNA-binding PadR family transcriptional regulator